MPLPKYSRRKGIGGWRCRARSRPVIEVKSARMKYSASRSSIARVSRTAQNPRARNLSHCDVARCSSLPVGRSPSIASQTGARHPALKANERSIPTRKFARSKGITKWRQIVNSISIGFSALRREGLTEKTPPLPNPFLSDFFGAKPERQMTVTGFDSNHVRVAFFDRAVSPLERLMLRFLDIRRSTMISSPSGIVRNCMYVNARPRSRPRYAVSNQELRSHPL